VKFVEIVKRHLSRIFGQYFVQDHHPLQMADHFTLHRENFFAICEHSTPLPYSSSTRYIDFHSTRVLV
jgi:hypothetical protein